MKKLFFLLVFLPSVIWGADFTEFNPFTGQLDATISTSTISDTFLELDGSNADQNINIGTHNFITSGRGTFSGVSLSTEVSTAPRSSSDVQHMRFGYAFDTAYISYINDEANEHPRFRFSNWLPPSNTYVTGVQASHYFLGESSTTYILGDAFENIQVVSTGGDLDIDVSSTTAKDVDLSSYTIKAHKFIFDNATGTADDNTYFSFNGSTVSLYVNSTLMDSWYSAAVVTYVIYDSTSVRYSGDLVRYP
jgi:hypothetical protein